MPKMLCLSSYLIAAQKAELASATQSENARLPSMSSAMSIALGLIYDPTTINSHSMFL